MINIIIPISIIIFFICLILYYKYIFFFRDPQRIIPQQKRIILSPADGVVVYIKKFKDNKIISQKLDDQIDLSQIGAANDFKNEGWIIGIYMRPMDVHFNYAPIGGQVEKIIYQKSKINWPMLDCWEYIKVNWLHQIINFWSKKFHLENERNIILLRNKDLQLLIIEIADKFVNKIDCFVKRGQFLNPGEKIGFIRRGSQVDLVIYQKKIKLKVRVGDHVLGSQTIIAYY